VLNAHPVEVLLDALVCPLGRLFQRKAVLDSVDGSLNRGRNALDAPLDGVPEHGDVALPPRGPLGSLLGETLLGARSHQVERGEARDASGAHAEDLSPGSGGDANRHDGGWEESWFGVVAGYAKVLMLVDELARDGWKWQRGQHYNRGRSRDLTLETGTEGRARHNNRVLLTFARNAAMVCDLVMLKTEGVGLRSDSGGYRQLGSMQR
jgi:hypothetical protein